MPETVMALPFTDAFHIDPAEPDWLQGARRDAWTRLEARGLPGPKDEAWRHSDVRAFGRERPLAGAGAAVSPADVAAAVTPADLEPFRRDGFAARVVLVDGRLRADLSDLGALPAGVEVLSLAAACRDDREEVRVHLGAATPDPDPFTLLNTALWTDGVFVNAHPSAAGTLHILHVRTVPGAVFSRVLVHVQGRASITVLEQAVELAGTGLAGGSRGGPPHADGPGADHVTFAVTELAAHPDASIHHDTIQDLGPAALWLHTLAIRQERASRVTAVQAAIGALHHRTTLAAWLADEGAEVALAGLYLGADKQRTDHWIRVDHAVPHCTSHQLYKGVLDDSSRGAFTGNVLVRPGAQQTVSEQENRNLLLSRDALADSTPQLEIHADDVKCSHGSTVGQLDEDAHFFLRSRGIEAHTATIMLTQAFAAEVVARFSLPAVQELVQQRITAWFGRNDP